MRLSELCGQLGVTTTAVYKRLKRDGLRIEEFRIPGSLDLSVDGQERILSMFAKHKPLTESSRNVHVTKTVTGSRNSSKNALAVQVQDQEREIIALQTKLEARTAEVDEWKERYEALVKSILARPALVAGADQEDNGPSTDSETSAGTSKKPTIRQRLRYFFKGK